MKYSKIFFNCQTGLHTKHNLFINTKELREIQKEGVKQN